MQTWSQKNGLPSPLGVTFITEENAFNFALYSKNASVVTLLLYNSASYSVPVVTKQLDYLLNKSQRIWHCRLSQAEIGDALYYAYQVDGPNTVTDEPPSWQMFDKDKILIDPYAKEVFFPPQFSQGAAVGPGSNAGQAPLGYIHPLTDNFDWQGDQPVRHEEDAVIYEMHVRGFTKNPNSNVTAGNEGTFAGVIEKIPYLTGLGVTAVELMPVHQFIKADDNFWGYSTLNFFSPHKDYSSDQTPGGAIKEFKTMVLALHKAGIEVIIDVVFNHTIEGDGRGPTYSFKGIDNPTYYLLTQSNPDIYENYSGCGNTMRTDEPVVQRLVIDSLKYWVTEMHVDGFRFDLATIFSVTSENQQEATPIFGELVSDKEFQNVRLIAEPWSGNGGQYPAGSYELGKSFPGTTWGQWNGKFRDDLRQLAISDANMVNSAITRIYGSNDLFPDDFISVNHPFQSVNFINCHDGLTLYDLVAYNSDSGWNCGTEGDPATPDVMSLRLRQAKNFFTLLMVSNGTPMFFYGDEFLRSQQGNNNAYDVDSTVTWLDWDRLNSMQDHFNFVLKSIAFRKSHGSIPRGRFWGADVNWYGPDGQTPNYGDQTLRSFAFGLKGGAFQDNDIYVMINFQWVPVTFNFSPLMPGPWNRIINTYLAPPNDFVATGQDVIAGQDYLVGERSIVVFIK